MPELQRVLPWQGKVWARIARSSGTSVCQFVAGQAVRTLSEAALVAVQAEEFSRVWPQRLVSAAPSSH